ncbi:MAG: hypothetical protein BWK76_17850 [Desulfobulbaceae bacterium A2]|nr:MAG: hypothetical protein BWK76_17850 [Desulfobulbaceae bacterium A2]
MTTGNCAVPGISIKTGRQIHDMNNSHFLLYQTEQGDAKESFQLVWDVPHISIATMTVCEAIPSAIPSWHGHSFVLA